MPGFTKSQNISKVQGWGKFDISLLATLVEAAARQDKQRKKVKLEKFEKALKIADKWLLLLLPQFTKQYIHAL